MLSSVNDPALRCPALWWAHILLSEVHNCCNPQNLGCRHQQFLSRSINLWTNPPMSCHCA
jgi:hypothetical protein